MRLVSVGSEMIELRTNDGDFRGATPDSIARRVYGPNAEYQPTADRNNPHAGLIVKRDRSGTHVLASVYWIQ